LDSVQEAIKSTIDSLNAQIADLQGQLASGATAEQIAEVAAKLDATKTDLEGTLG
jgi:peptidoglycan hydrolase CwlO-like protein